MNQLRLPTNAINVDLRLCKPVGVQRSPVINGLGEFFDPARYASGPLAIMLCSFWVDGDSTAKLIELQERCRCQVWVRVLPLPKQVDNRAGINAEALRAKLYLLARNPAVTTFKTEEQLKAIRAEGLLEGFFGSPNFTGKGLHCGDHASNHKWGTVARATEPKGRELLLDQFRELWRSAHRVEKDNPNLHRDWHWPYNQGPK